MSREEALERLRERATALNAATDQLSEAFASLNARLGEMGIGVSIWIEPPIRQLDDTESDWLLGYYRLNGTYQIAVKRGDDSPTNIGAAPRAIRIAAAARLDELIEKLTNKVAEYAKHVASVRSRL